MTTIAETAEFNGKNLITAGATDLQVLSTVEGSTITVSAQSLNAMTLLINPATLATANSASQGRIILDTAIARVSNSWASLGSVAKRVDIQAAFTSKLMDIMKQGVGNLVDADLAEESANLQAIQIKQQLGVQAFAIANGSPQVFWRCSNKIFCNEFWCGPCNGQKIQTQITCNPRFATPRKPDMVPPLHAPPKAYDEEATI